jgi:hypothetical protein
VEITRVLAASLRADAEKYSTTGSDLSIDDMGSDDL